MTPIRVSLKSADQIHFLQELLQSLPTPVFYKDLKGVYVGCNHAFALFLGIDRDKITGKTVYEVAPTELARVYDEADRELMERGGMQVYEAGVQTPLGVRDVVFYKATIAGRDGKVCGLVGTILDISERKQEELALLQSQQELEQRVRERTQELLAANRELLKENREREIAEHALRDENAFNRAIIDTVAEGLCVCHNCDEYPHVHFTVWNRRMTDITGYTMDEINRLGWYQTVYADPELRQRAMERMARMREGDDLVREEWPIVAADGSERILEIYTSILKEVEGKVYVLGVMQDVTERKRREEELRTTQRHLTVLLASGAAVIYGVNDFNVPTVNFISDNVTRVTGFSPNDFQTQGFWADRIHPEDAPGLFAQMAQVAQIDGSETFVHEYRWRVKDGSYRWMRDDMRILRGEEETCPEVVGSWLDVTESKSLQLELMASHEELRRLAAHLETVRENERRDMAREVHDELGQSLTGLRLDLAWLARKAATSAPELIPKIRDMGRTVNSSIHSVQRIAAQLRPRVLDDLGLAAAVEWQVNDFRKRTGTPCRLTIQEDMADPDPKVSTALFRILQEALTNVIRHAQATKVSVSLCFREGMVVLDVTDNGRGIEETEVKSSCSCGLVGMRERAHGCGGIVAIEGGAGRGTSVKVYIPMDRGETEE